MAKSNFLRGMGSVINLFPEDREIALPLPTHSDEEAFKKDLQQVGSDMYAALEAVKQSHTKLFKQKQ
jgi:hypothetical protein